MINTVCVSVCARSCACTLFLQLYPTLCGPMDRRPLGFSVHGISQARMLEQAAFPTPGDLPDPGIKPASLASPALAGGFFTTSTTWEAVHTHTHTHVQRYIDVCVCTVAAVCQLPSPGDLPYPETEPAFPVLQAGSLPLSHWGSPVYMYLEIQSQLYIAFIYIICIINIGHVYVNIIYNKDICIYLPICLPTRLS